MFALITDPKAPTFVLTQLSSPEASMETRTAQMRLSASGSLEGDVKESYTGHRAEGRRDSLAGKSAAQREEWLRERIVRMFPDAEVTSVKLENVEDPAKPLSASYHLAAPQFAQVTGKRILFQPNAFRRVQASPLAASERRLPVEFPYGWKEIDRIRIELPEGFTLDNADSPGSLDFGEPGSYKLEMSIARGIQQEFITSREFTFGNKSQLNYPQSTYASLKKIFDAIQSRDIHAVSLKAD